jgi:hypothetical protein
MKIKLFDKITAPFAVLFDESRRTNEDGSWDKYNRKQNCKAELRELKAEYKQNRKNIKTWWRIEE